MQRRSFLKLTAGGLGAGLVGARFLGLALPGAYAADGPYGPLQAADGNGIQLPAGFTSRVVATSGSVVPGTSYTWHGAPDGGACFPTAGGGWVYVSNSELSPGGAGALRFDSRRRGHVAPTGSCRAPPATARAGHAVGHLAVVRGDQHRPGVGVRPARGRRRRWSARPWARSTTRRRPCDPVGQHVYLTEDAGSGKLRRFRPTTWGDLSAGTLEAAVVSGSTVTWTTTISQRHLLQRRRGRLVRRRQGVVHHQGRQPGVGARRAGRPEHHPGHLRRQHVAEPGAHRGRQHRRLGLGRPVRGRGRREHGAGPHRAERRGVGLPAGAQPVRLRDRRPGLQPRPAAGCTSARSGARAAPGRASPTR